MTAGLAIALGLLAWGAHATVPWRLPAATKAARRSWTIASGPLLLAATILALLKLRTTPDPAVAQGLAGIHGDSPLVVATAVAVLLLLAADFATALLGLDRLGERVEPMLGSLGIGALCLVSIAGELLRIGLGPESTAPAFLVAVGVRCLLALAAGEALAPGRPAFAPWAGALLPVYLFVLPAPLVDEVFATGLHFTALAGAALLLAAHWLPERWARPSLLAATLLSGLFLARVAELSSRLGSALIQGPPSVM